MLQAEATLWNRCVQTLQAELTEQEFNTWIRPLQAVEDGHMLRLLAPNHFVINWIEQHYLKKISKLLGKQLNPVLQVGSRQTITTEKNEKKNRPSIQPIAKTKSIENRLNPAFTFNTFVEGKSNQLARAAASQVSKNPGKSYNPLFIYGGVGLGKTHLMQAIGNALLTKNLSAKVSYLHSERFVSDMVKGLQHNTISEFKRVYRSLDSL